MCVATQPFAKNTDKRKKPTHNSLERGNVNESGSCVSPGNFLQGVCGFSVSSTLSSRYKSVLCVGNGQSAAHQLEKLEFQ